MNRIVLMFLVTTLDFCLPSTGHLWPHWHHWPKLFDSTSCSPWQHYIVTLSPDVSQYFVACAFILSYLRNPLPLDTWTANFSIAGIRVAYELLDESCVRFGHAITFTKSNVELRTIHHYFHKLVTLEECVAFDLELLGTSLQVWNSKTILAKPFSVFNLAVSQTFLGYSITDIWKQNRKSTLQRFRVLSSCRLFCWESSSSSASWKRHSPIVIWKMA